MPKTKMPKIPKKKVQHLERLLLAHKRLGESPAARLNWLLAFKDRDLDLLHPEEREALGYDLQAFISHSGSGLHTGYSLKPMPSGLAMKIQMEVRQGFANLFSETYTDSGSPIREVWHFPPPEDVFLQRTSLLNAKRSNIEMVMDLYSHKPGRLSVDPKAAILYGILNTIREGQNLLRACSECKAPFIPVRRQEYCSTKCSQKARDRRRKKK
jgi:hypothetical protein